jgi:hypothetical protein
MDLVGKKLKQQIGQGADEYVGEVSMNRRKFLKQAALWSAGLVAVPPVFDLCREAVGAVKDNASELFVSKGKNIPGMVRQLVDAMGGMNRFVKKGDTVVVKPNIGWDRTVEQAANTHPEVVTALAALALEAGPQKSRCLTGLVTKSGAVIRTAESNRPWMP